MQRLEEYRKEKEEKKEQTRLEQVKRPPFRAGKASDKLLQASKIPFLKVYGTHRRSSENTPK